MLPVSLPALYLPLHNMVSGCPLITSHHTKNWPQLVGRYTHRPSQPLAHSPISELASSLSSSWGSFCLSQSPSEMSSHNSNGPFPSRVPNRNRSINLPNKLRGKSEAPAYSAWTWGNHPRCPHKKRSCWMPYAFCVPHGQANKGSQVLWGSQMLIDWFFHPHNSGSPEFHTK